MQPYSDYPLVRAWQIVADIVALAAIAAFISLGIAAGSLVASLAALGQQIQEAGTGFADTMADAARTLGDVPLIGATASSSFQSASTAGEQLAAAGQQQQDLVGNAAVIVGLVVAGLPVLLILLVWLRPRLRFARHAASVRSLSATAAGLDLLALRALAGQKSAVVLAVGPDPVAGWRAGDPLVVRILADLELRSAGVRTR
ncbi:hypothetical protein [Subtercola boreus]|uniref:Transmembrane protein n=1 Tax=Subtercola boreus TaxID=120213 RepID=A0A3E0WFD9_9MICO|nr:hypothetical protein [Subtercola boreus]RFA22813.1 hypothetical protein B7R24_04220 [Subtercola boreus]RFA23168.1 hypothetical protein B7R23_04215 [Subtercola boreus]RFA28921.1 hypothetical protein B7R25_04230 [Subtercola boreus]